MKERFNQLEYSREYSKNYKKENYDRLNLQMPKGLKEKAREFAKEKRGLSSLNAYIVYLIQKDMEENSDEQNS